MFSSYTKQVEGQGMKPTTRTVDSGFAKAAGSIAKFFDAAVGSKLVKLVRLRYLDDAPLCLETTYLPPSFETLIDQRFALRDAAPRIPSRASTGT